MALGTQVIDFVRLNIAQQPGERTGIVQVGIMQEKFDPRCVKILVKVIDALGIERRSSPFESVDLVAALNEKFGEIGTILPGDSGD
jgi:hypothetical protein